MATISKQITALSDARGVDREEVKSGMREDAAILSEVLDRMNVIEAKQSRPSPVQLRTWDEIERFAEKAAKSGMVPKDFVGKSDAICIAIQMGSELGLPPMQSLQNIAVVNGRPSIWGDAMPALCRASGVVRSIREWSEGEGDYLTFCCEAIRKDDPNPVLGRFSVLDAKRAGLWKETPKTTRRGRDGSYEVDSGPWYSYPHRMLQMRARGFALRDAFPDVLRGLMSAEEAADIPFEATGLTPRQEPLAPPKSIPSDAGKIAQEVADELNQRELSWSEEWNDRLADEPNGTKRLKLLDTAFGVATTREDIEDLSGRPCFRATYEAAPDMIKERMNDMLRKAVARFDVVAEPDFISGEVENV